MNGAESLKYQVLREEDITPYARRLLAMSPQTEGQYLIEVLDGAPSAGAAFESFTRDLATVSLLGHPCVLEVTEVATLPDGALVIISELPLDGLRLSQVVTEGRTITSSAALDIVAGVGDALDAAAERGIHHGAVDVHHVILAGGELGMPKLHGFRQRALREPESRKGRTSDLRALATLAELLLTPPELRTSGPTRSFGTAGGVAIVIARAMSADGFSSARDFVAALQSALERDVDGNSVSLQRSDWAIQLPQRPRRRPSRLATGLMAGCALSLLGLFAMFQVRHRWALDDQALGLRTAAVATPAAPVVRPVPVAVPAAVPAVAAPAALPPAPKPVIATNAPEPHPPRASTPLRDMVWSDRAQRLVPIYENAASDDGPRAAGGLAP